MLLITLFISTLCVVRQLAGSDLQPRIRQNGFAVTPIGSASAHTFSDHRRPTTITTSGEM
jgi:hypothetical protein